jgi:hypothetical protein
VAQSYSEGREQEDHGSKPAQAKFVRPYLEKTHHKKRVGRVAQGKGPEFKPQYGRKKKRRRGGGGGRDSGTGYSINLEDIMLSEISQSQKGKYCLIPFICGPQRSQILISIKDNVEW